MSAAITKVDVNVERKLLSRWTGAVSALLNVGFVLMGADGGIDDATATAWRLFGAADADSLRARWDPIQEKLAPSLRASGPTTVTLTFDVSGETRRVRCEVHPLKEDDCVGHLLL